MVDLNKLTPLQNKVAHKFMDALQAGKRVNFEDFPEMEQSEFEELAERICDAIEKEMRH